MVVRLLYLAILRRSYTSDRHSIHLYQIIPFTRFKSLSCALVLRSLRSLVLKDCYWFDNVTRLGSWGQLHRSCLVEEKFRLVENIRTVIPFWLIGCSKAWLGQIKLSLWLKEGALASFRGWKLVEFVLWIPLVSEEWIHRGSSVILSQAHSLSRLSLVDWLWIIIKVFQDRLYHSWF